MNEANAIDETHDLDHPIIESLPQVLHLIRVAFVPSLRSLPLPSFVVALDPHLGQLGTSPSEGCFVMLPVAGWAIAFVFRS